MDQLLLWLHVVAAGVWLGGNAAQVTLTPRMARSDATMAAFLRGTVAMGTRLYTPAAILILATGLVMVARNPAYDYDQAFVVIGVLVVVIGAVLGMAVFGPQGRRAAELREGGETSAARQVERRLAAFGTLDTVLILVAFAAMVWRLGA